MIAGLRLSLPFDLGDGLRPDWPMNRLVEFFADNLEKPEVRKAATVMVDFYSQSGKVKNKNGRSRRFITRKNFLYN